MVEPENTNDPAHPAEQVDAQARQQTGQQKVRLHINEAEIKTSYTNAFRTNCSAEEVIIDFGMHMVVPNPDAQQKGDGRTQPAGELTFQPSVWLCCWGRLCASMSNGLVI